MIVDDDPIVRSTMGRTLSARGFAVVPADSAEQGLKLMKETKVDLVIADVDMPAMDGLRFLLHVKAQFPECATLIMTASRATDLRSLTYSGFDAAKLIRKGISDDELQQVIERELRETAA